MKKLLFILLTAAISVTSFAQKANLNKSQPLTWLGIDYSQLRFIGTAAQWKDAGEISDEKLSGTYFKAWNDLVVNEPDKYNIKKATGFNEVILAPEVTEAVNNKNRKASYFTEDGNAFQRMTEADVQKEVKQYNYAGHTGTGLVFIVEGMDKGREAASVWVAFVDMKTKELLAARHYVSKASGFGFRNYWAGAIKSTLKNMKGDF